MEEYRVTKLLKFILKDFNRESWKNNGQQNNRVGKQWRGHEGV